MKNNTLDTTAVPALLILLVSLISGASMAIAGPPPVYDRFNGEYLNMAKWRPGSFSTNIQTGYLEMAAGNLNMGMRTFADFDGTIGGTGASWSNLWLSRAKSNRAKTIQTTIRLKKLLAEACTRANAATSYAEFQLRAYWFNDGTTPPASTPDLGIGDVYTNLSLSQSSKPDDPIYIFANVFHVTTQGLSRVYSNSLGKLRNKNRPVTLRTTWIPDQRQIHFYKNVPGEGARKLVYNYSGQLRSRTRPAWNFNGKGLTLRTFPAYCGNKLTIAEVEAVVEEVRVRE